MKEKSYYKMYLYLEIILRVEKLLFDEILI